MSLAACWLWITNRRYEAKSAEAKSAETKSAEADTGRGGYLDVPPIC